jgi:hypothetical protein
MRTTNPPNSPVSLRIRCARLLLPLAILAAALCGAQMLSAQTPAAAASSAPAHRAVHRHKRPVAAKAKSSTSPAAPALAVPAAPAVPLWPANEKPAKAAVTWDSQGLRIDAANSSLAQILEDVATATGAKVEGFDTDERIFGVYGPGPARDVLSQLLQGAGYNVILIGDQGQGTPREILLSSSHAGAAASAANAAPASAGDEEADPEEQPQPAPPPIPQPVPQPVRPGFGPGGQPRTPQQIQQEMQQRQQQIQQQQAQPASNPS